MTPNSGSSNVTDNVVSDNGTQTNTISYTTYNTFYAVYNPKQLAEHYLKLNGEQHTSELTSFLHTVYPDPCAVPTSNGTNDMRAANDTEKQHTKNASEGCRSKPEYVPDPSSHKEDKTTSFIHRRVSINRNSVFHSLNHSEQGKIDKWLRSKSTQMLLVVAGEKNKNGQPRTTKLAQEMKQLIENTIKDLGFDNHGNAVVARFCDRKTANDGCELVYDLLQQMRQVCKEGGSNHPTTSKSVGTLLDSLKTGILDLRIRSLAIMLDKVEVLPRADFDILVSKLDRIRKSLWTDNNVLIKVLVTSGDVSKREHFQENGTPIIVLRPPNRKLSRE